MENLHPSSQTKQSGGKVKVKKEPVFWNGIDGTQLRNVDHEIPDETTLARGEDAWTKERPPVMFGMLDPPETIRKVKGQTAALVLDENRRRVEGSEGLTVRDLPNLPRYISSDSQPMEMEFFFRADPRCGYNDIRARQCEWRAYNNPPRRGPPEEMKGNPLRRPNNSINNARRRMVRGPLVMRDWSVKHEGRGSKIFITLLDKLTQLQIDHNTTWVVTPDGIHPPTNKELVFPHFAFLSNGFPHKPSPETQKALILLAKIRRMARDKGLDHWSQLQRDVLPASWFKKRPRDKLNGDEDTNDESKVDIPLPPKKKRVKRESSIEAKIAKDVRAYVSTPPVDQAARNDRGASHAGEDGNDPDFSDEEIGIIRAFNLIPLPRFDQLLRVAAMARGGSEDRTIAMNSSLSGFMSPHEFNLMLEISRWPRYKFAWLVEKKGGNAHQASMSNYSVGQAHDDTRPTTQQASLRIGNYQGNHSNMQLPSSTNLYQSPQQQHVLPSSHSHRSFANHLQHHNRLHQQTDINQYNLQGHSNAHTAPAPEHSAYNMTASYSGPRTPSSEEQQPNSTLLATGDMQVETPRIGNSQIMGSPDVVTPNTPLYPSHNSFQMFDAANTLIDFRGHDGDLDAPHELDTDAQ
ncbi:MAG: hypothetical protein LQ340_005172 [Diploschistes diacapsis]|nr:MAG: hypothetical protein LQ340_005172 [Diploschistes diacapsis]